FFFFSSRRRHTRFSRDWSSDVCSSDLIEPHGPPARCCANRSTRQPSEMPSQNRYPIRYDWKKFASPNRASAAAPSTAITPTPSEIGRASCREREKVTEVAVARKKRAQS